MITLEPSIQAEIDRIAFKEKRGAAVAAIKVTTQAGNTFDGDERSQGRMARAILVLQDEPVGTLTTWVLADNTEAQVGLDELREAFKLAGLEQTRLWVFQGGGQ
jgi:hypothetical protein